MDAQPPGGDDGRRGDDSRRGGKAAQAADEADAVDVFGDATELPAWVFLLLAAMLAEHFRSYMCTC